MIKIGGIEFEEVVEGCIIDRNSEMVTYDANYMDAYVERSKTHMSDQLTNFRKAYSECFAGKDDKLLDVGCAVGLIIQQDKSERWYGTDINPLSESFIGDKFIPHLADFSKFDVLTFHDCLEHFQNPEEVLQDVKSGARVVVIVPIWPKETFDETLIEWLHYKVGEHFIYFTHRGIINFMELQGFALIDNHTVETSMGRLNCGTFAFKKG